MEQNNELILYKERRMLMNIEFDNMTYKIGLCIRIFCEDDDDLESDSIGNQRNLLNAIHY